jgi:hypothetical protein
MDVKSKFFHVHHYKMYTAFHIKHSLTDLNQNTQNWIKNPGQAQNYPESNLKSQSEPNLPRTKFRIPGQAWCLISGTIVLFWCFISTYTPHRVSLIFNVDYFIYLICALILTADFSVYLAWLTDFDCGLFCLLKFDTLNLTSDIWNGAHGGCDQSAEDAYSSAAPDPTFAFVGGPCCLTLDFVNAFWITIAFYTLLTSLFCTCIYNCTRLKRVAPCHGLTWP